MDWNLEEDNVDADGIRDIVNCGELFDGDARKEAPALPRCPHSV